MTPSPSPSGPLRLAYVVVTPYFHRLDESGDLTAIPEPLTMDTPTGPRPLTWRLPAAHWKTWDWEAAFLSALAKAEE